MVNYLFDLKELRKRILQFQEDKHGEKFDKWLVAQTIRDDIPKYYSDFISELLAELEGLRVEFLENINWEKTPENKSNYNEIIYSKIFVEDILHRVDKKIRELEKNERNR